MYALQSFKGWFYRSLLDLRTFKVFQGSYSSPIFNHASDFCLDFEPSWKSGLAKTGSALGLHDTIYFKSV